MINSFSAETRIFQRTRPSSYSLHCQVINNDFIEYAGLTDHFVHPHHLSWGKGCKYIFIFLEISSEWQGLCQETRHTPCVFLWHINKFFNGSIVSMSPTGVGEHMHIKCWNDINSLPLGRQTQYYFQICNYQTLCGDWHLEHLRWNSAFHDDVIKWKHFPRYWPFVRGIHRSRWIPRTKASHMELWCFRSSASE